MVNNSRADRLIVSVVGVKGGSGKSLVATSFAVSLAHENSVQFLDCDVEEPDANIFLRPSFVHRETVAVPIPKVDVKKCNYCSDCARICAYNAIVVFAKHVLIFPELCSGCGACSYFCSPRAISEELREIGTIETGDSDNIQFVHGRLNTGETMVAPIIRKIKGYASQEGIIIIEAPSTKSCSVLGVVKDSNFCLLVSEPTPFGLDGLKMTAKSVGELGIPCGVVLNRTGAGYTKIEEYCNQENIPIMLSIPQETEIARLHSRGITLADGKSEWRGSFIKLFDRIREIVSERDSCAQR